MKRETVYMRASSSRTIMFQTEDFRRVAYESLSGGRWLLLEGVPGNRRFPAAGTDDVDDAVRFVATGELPR